MLSFLTLNSDVGIERIKRNSCIPSLVPQLNLVKLTNILHRVSSRKKHISWGCQYFGAGYIHSMRVKKTFQLCVKTWHLYNAITIYCMTMWYQWIFKGEHIFLLLILVSIYFKQNLDIINPLFTGTGNKSYTFHTNNSLPDITMIMEKV